MKVSDDSKKLESKIFGDTGTILKNNEPKVEKKKVSTSEKKNFLPPPFSPLPAGSAKKTVLGLGVPEVFKSDGKAKGRKRNKKKNSKYLETEIQKLSNDLEKLKEDVARNTIPPKAKVQGLTFENYEFDDDNGFREKSEDNFQNEAIALKEENIKDEDEEEITIKIEVENQKKKQKIIHAPTSVSEVMLKGKDEKSDLEALTWIDEAKPQKKGPEDKKIFEESANEWFVEKQEKAKNNAGKTKDELINKKIESAPMAHDSTSDKRKDKDRDKDNNKDTDFAEMISFESEKFMDALEEEKKKKARQPKKETEEKKITEKKANKPTKSLLKILFAAVIFFAGAYLLFIYVMPQLEEVSQTADKAYVMPVPNIEDEMIIEDDETEELEDRVEIDQVEAEKTKNVESGKISAHEIGDDVASKEIIFPAHFREGNATFWFNDKESEEAFVADFLRRAGDRDIIIKGYITPMELKKEFIQAARSRAWAVHKYLQRKGIENSRITSVPGYLKGGLPVDSEKLVIISIVPKDDDNNDI